MPANTPDLSDVSCATPSDCLAVGLGGSSGSYPVFTETTDGGALWTTQPMSSGFGFSNWGDLSCALPPSCYLSKNLSSVMRSTDGGASWTRVPGSLWQAIGGPDFPAWFDDMTCVRGSSVCAIVGTTSRNTFEFGETRDGGTTLHRIAVLRDVRGKDGYLVSCATPQTCMVASPLRTRVLTTIDGGARWAIRSLPKEIEQVHAISCPTATECVALVVGSRHPAELLAGTTLNGGMSWSMSTVAPDPDPNSTASISCPSAAECYVDGPATPHGTVYVRAGTQGRWVQTSVP